MPHFDFHHHPLFKNFICNYEDTYPTSRDATSLTKAIDLRNPIIDIADELFLHMLESQSSIQQMRKGELILGVANIAPLEEIFTGNKGLFNKILHSGFFTAPLDQQYFDLVRTRQISYYQLLIKELNLYKSIADKQEIKLYSRKTGNLQQLLNSQKGILLVMGIEGGHSLSRSLIGQPGSEDKLIVNTTDALSIDFIKSPSLTAAKSLQQLHKAMWAEGMDICYLILTHLSHIREQFLATHAYGMKMLEHDLIYPNGNGISQAGKDVIDTAYKMEVGDQKTPILIDIKHMGLKSRLDLYAYRQEKDYSNIPLIASHIGVTGYSTEEWKAALEDYRIVSRNGIPYVSIIIERKTAGNWGIINKNFTFNAWTINLMDEDIEEVLKSNGLIGVSLDVRILGWQNALEKEDKEEFMSWEDFRYFFPQKAANLKRDEVAQESKLLPTKEERHPLALCFNILHIIAVGKLMRDTIDPWKKICIGSDYDGLINPVISCKDAGELSSLEKLLLKWLPVAEEAYRKEIPGIPLIPKQNGEVDINQLREKIQDILYENGKNFLIQWDQLGKTPSFTKTK